MSIKSSTYVNNVRVTLNSNKLLIFSFHHLKTQQECIATIHKHIEDYNKAHYQNDRVKSIEFIDDYVVVMTDSAEKDK
jgi:hypothetical protein